MKEPRPHTPSVSLSLTLPQLKALQTALGYSSQRYSEDVDRIVHRLDKLIATFR